MKRVIPFLVLIAVTACAFKKEPPKTKNAYFEGIMFKASGVSDSKVNLSISLQYNDLGEKHYYLVARSIETDKDHDLNKLLCTFDVEDLTLVKDVLHSASAGASIVLRPAKLSEQETQSADQQIQDIFLSLDTPEELEKKTTEELMSDSKTIVLVRHIDVKKATASKALCEFSYTMGTSEPQKTQTESPASIRAQ